MTPHEQCGTHRHLCAVTPSWRRETLLCCNGQVLYVFRNPFFYSAFLEPFRCCIPFSLEQHIVGKEGLEPSTTGYDPASIFSLIACTSQLRAAYLRRWIYPLLCRLSYLPILIYAKIIQMFQTKKILLKFFKSKLTECLFILKFVVTIYGPSSISINHSLQRLYVISFPKYR
jgi:hypothetical protein